VERGQTASEEALSSDKIGLNPIDKSFIFKRFDGENSDLNF